ncbi:LacI family transcriptional regulator [Streptomyces sp. JH002]|uniref:LacI family DNA-binding transcriptional regulator n=1 Tax=Streptomyces TaxID=1883 RepID=UPI0036B22B1D
MPVKRHRQAPTQSDVARRAGVSQATVSAVVNGRAASSRIPAETERLVKDTIRELGYAANPAARSLKGKGNRLLGVHTFEAVFPISSRDFYHGFLIGVEEQAVAEGYDLVLFTSTEDDNGERRLYRDGTNRLNVADGSVLLGITHDHSDVARLSRDGYPFVHIGRRAVSGADIAWVSADYTAGTRDAVQDLIGAGHTRIGYLGLTDRTEPLADREAGYRAACAAAGIPPLPVLMNPHDLEQEWFDLAIGSGITAFVAEEESLTDRIAAFAAHRALRIPADLSVVTLRDTSGGPYPGTSWSSLGIPRNAIGRAAVRLLVETLHEPDTPRPRQILLACAPPVPSTIAAPPTRQGVS